MGSNLRACFHHFGCFVRCGICVVGYALEAPEEDEATLFEISFEHGKGGRTINLESNKAMVFVVYRYSGVSTQVTR
jgi:hypothetical protein